MQNYVLVAFLCFLFVLDFSGPSSVVIQKRWKKNLECTRILPPITYKRFRYFIRSRFEELNPICGDICDDIHHSTVCQRYICVMILSFLLPATSKPKVKRLCQILGFGRYTNPDYREFLRVLRAAQRNFNAHNQVKSLFQCFIIFPFDISI